MECSKCKKPITSKNSLVVASTMLIYKWIRCYHKKCFNDINIGVESIPTLKLDRLDKLMREYYFGLSTTPFLIVVSVVYMVVMFSMPLTKSNIFLLVVTFSFVIAAGCIAPLINLAKIKQIRSFLGQ